MKFHIITIFPDAFKSYINSSIIKRAQERNIIEILFYDLWDYSSNKTRRVDDKPFWWFVGAIISPEPLAKAIKSIQAQFGKLDIIYLSPRWTRLKQQKLEKLSEKNKDLILICWHYEWIDERIIKLFKIKEVSVWDYILTSWELWAMILLDGITRLLPWVISPESLIEESFSQGLNRKKEYPQYTRPREFMWERVPEELLSGDPKIINNWKKRFL